jgi:hypothetical protein
MVPAVNLQHIVDQMDLTGDQVTAYINRRDGELVVLTDCDLSIAETDNGLADVPEWQQDVILEARRVLADKNFVALPDQYDTHEYEIMERFCHSLENERIQNILLSAIAGRGAFRRFKDLIFAEGISKDWFLFKNAALKRIAADFLDSENIAYSDE